MNSDVSPPYRDRRHSRDRNSPSPPPYRRPSYSERSGGRGGGGGGGNYNNNRGGFHREERFKSYVQFLRTCDDNIDEVAAKDLYNTYKNEYMFKRTEAFYSQHKDEEWFNRLYHPIIREELLAGRKRAQVAAYSGLHDGMMDVDVERERFKSMVFISHIPVTITRQVLEEELTTTFMKYVYLHL